MEATQTFVNNLLKNFQVACKIKNFEIPNELIEWYQKEYPVPHSANTHVIKSVCEHTFIPFVEGWKTCTKCDYCIEVK